jgi:peptidoglycan hydrolase-like protein with peptidoglycan-binding domain
VPHAVLLLPQIRRVSAAVLIALAVSMTLAASGAFAEEGTTAGGATATEPAAAAPAKPKVRKISTKRIQKALGIKADGVLGPKTRRAIKRFQKAHGLKADGVAGTATLQALGLLPTAEARSLDSVTPGVDAAAALAKIAQCESGGNVAAVSPSGQYRGKYQFSQATWEALGGTGDPAEAAESVQDAIAAKLYAERGAAPWPSCAPTVSG